MRRVLGVAIAGLVLAGGLAAVTDESTTGARTLVTGRAERSGTETLERVPERRPRPWSGGPGAVRASSASDAAVVELLRHDSCAGLLDHLRGRALPLVTEWGLGGGGGVAATPTAGAADAGGAAASGTGGSFSTTNVQERGIDEPDIVKNDATRLFTVFDATLRSLVIDDDGVPRVVDSLALPAPGYELLLHGERLVAIATDHQASSPTTRLLVVDVRDPQDIATVADVKLDGWYISSRQVDGSVRIVLTQPGPDLPFTFPRSDDPDERARALAHNRAVIVSSIVSDWLPEVTACDDVYTPMTVAGFASTTVLTFDAVAGEVLSSASVVADAGEVYSSPTHLYVASGVLDAVAVDGVPAAVTHIHRFDLTDRRRVVYEASGVVPGHLLRPFMWGGSGMGQWSMSEHEDLLRVATTMGGSWDEATASQSAVTVLRVEGDRLVPIGAVHGLGVGEQIYAVRFMGARGYVVTYRKTDPLYVLDLADPRAPRVAGELKIPGYSAYLHPVEDGRLLGIGQDDPDEDGMADGTQASLFDVGDPTAPRRIDQLSLGERGTVSGVEHDHRAFTWWAEPRRGVIPLTIPRDGFTGAIVIGLEDDALTEIGRISHGAPSRGDCQVPIERSRVIGDSVFTFSHTGVAVHGLDDVEARFTTAYSEVSPHCHAEPDERPPTTTTTTTLVGLGLEPD